MDNLSNPPRNVLSWLRQNAIPLQTVEQGHSFTDLQPLKSTVDGARIVALGEATHGTREFFHLKHRLLEFLVIEMGFTTFALEANWPESLEVNEYVLHGRGDPAKLLAGLHCWTWNTEELLNLILWMRHYNLRVSGKAQVAFAGFDAQFTASAAASVRKYLTEVDPEFAVQIVPRLTPFDQEYRSYSTLSETDIEALHSTVQGIAERLRVKEQTYIDRSTVQKWRFARQYARILYQVDEQRRAVDDKNRYMARDRAMAENVAWLLESEGPHSKMVLWAHNAHVARDPRGIFDGAIISMGMHLARRFASDLVVIGFAFGEGAFQAVVIEEGGRRPLRAVAIGPPPTETLDAVLAQTAIPMFIVDLRRVHDTGVAAWFQRPQITREIGAFFEDPEGMHKAIVPMARYDALAFIANTTGTRLTPRLKPV